MKNMVFKVILFFSILLIVFLVYINYFGNRIYFIDFKDDEEVEVFSKYNDNKIKVCYGNKIKCKRISYKKDGIINIKKIGTYKVKYYAKYKNKELTKIKSVKVVDKIAPELFVEGNFDDVCPNGKSDKLTYRAIDNYDGDLTNKILYKVSNDKVLYKVKDSSGNITFKEFNIKINDTEKPSLILNDDSIIYLGVGNEYIEPGYTAVDNCDGDITNKVIKNGNVDINKAGTYEITYSIKDEFGNENKLIRTIKVFPKNNYTPNALSNKTVYLTFDDGPGKDTARLLDILKKYNVKATFFVTGYDNKYNDLITREHDEGHTVGLHSYSHNYAKIYSSTQSYMEDLLAINDKVKQYTKEDSKIIRFPGGSSNTISRRYRNGIMSELTMKVEEIGFRYFDWTISSGDAGNTKDTNQIVHNVTSSIKEDKVNVVLMHDIKSYSVDAVEKIIQYGLSNGYTFAPLNVNSPLVHQKVNN